MPTYTVTGGEDGLAGIEIDGTRYEAGEIITSPTKKVDWLVEQGYLKAVSSSKAASVEDK